MSDICIFDKSKEIASLNLLASTPLHLCGSIRLKLSNIRKSIMTLEQKERLYNELLGEVNENYPSS